MMISADSHLGRRASGRAGKNTVADHLERAGYGSAGARNYHGDCHGLDRQAGQPKESAGES